jgi:LysR family transcriptional regulator, regulator for genes of the gallate degradation pathway
MHVWDFNLRHIRAVAEIERLGSISAAAEAVSLTQPAITQALGKLEDQLGLPLFLRRPDGMEALESVQLIAPRFMAAEAHIASPRVTMAQVRALIALADAGSYSAASAMTGLSQPSLHRAIQDLTYATKRPLVERRGRGVMLTDAGRRTVRAFRLARAELEAGLAELERLKGRETGRIAIGAMPLSRARILPDAVTAFHARFPDVAITIAEGSWAELVEPLRDGELDLMVGAIRSGPEGNDLEQRPLFDDAPVILGRYDHPLARRAAPPPDLSEIASYPWTVPAPGTPLRIQWEAMFRDAGIPVPRVPVECGSVMMIRQILVGSDFLTLLSPDQVAVELEAKWLTRIADAPSGLVRTIGVTTRAGWVPTGQQRAFLDLLDGALPGPSS